MSFHLLFLQRPRELNPCPPHPYRYIEYRYSIWIYRISIYHIGISNIDISYRYIEYRYIISIYRISKYHIGISNIHENRWESMKINENQWKSIKININQWKSIRINENHWKSHAAQAKHNIAKLKLRNPGHFQGLPTPNKKIKIEKLGSSGARPSTASLQSAPGDRKKSAYKVARVPRLIPTDLEFFHPPPCECIFS